MNRGELEDLARKEVERFHAFVAAWFRGEVARSEALFAREVTDRLAEDLINIQPAGQALRAAELLPSLFQGHGANPAFEIEIEGVSLLGVYDSGRLLLATYLEHQRGAKNTTPPDNTRRSSVLFRLDPETRALTWLHVHETGLPAP